MFRKMRRIKQQISEQECVEVLTNAPRGVLAVHGEDGYPYAIPMNHIYREGKIYFHGAKVGHKLDALAVDDKVSFCVMDEGFRKDGEWALNIKSVVIFGRIKKVEVGPEATEILRQIGLKHYPTAESVEEEIRKAGAHVQILELSIDHMTGKLVNES
ncbi:pyridoxamine 5'-phosphate oxidase family protein [Scatolibacter rhodanostii]|uniref:pyridoxamine 5'-phosphate oxidase family protein n=1 Tax=Scatolibacter rhodanostii TaxID=2014781 RepID=UPI000C083942|nr:pyridoxamine 5'-phosphate oxidase family protein [Scatolibacter rhodanostii]